MKTKFINFVRWITLPFIPHMLAAIFCFISFKVALIGASYDSIWGYYIAPTVVSYLSGVIFSVITYYWAPSHKTVSIIILTIIGSIGIFLNTYSDEEILVVILSALAYYCGVFYFIKNEKENFDTYLQISEADHKDLKINLCTGGEKADTQR